MNFDRALAVALIAHTVEFQPGRYVAGHLVRRSGREIGYVWQVGTSWQWKTPRGDAYGERSSLNAALTVLVDIANLPARAPLADYSTSTASRRTAPPKAAPLRTYDDRQRAPRASTSSAPAPAAAAAPPPAPQAPKTIIWADINPESLRAAIAQKLGQP